MRKEMRLNYDKGMALRDSFMFLFMDRGFNEDWFIEPTAIMHKDKVGECLEIQLEISDHSEGSKGRAFYKIYLGDEENFPSHIRAFTGVESGTSKIDDTSIIEDWLENPKHLEAFNKLAVSFMNKPRGNDFDIEGFKNSLSPIEDHPYRPTKTQDMIYDVTNGSDELYAVDYENYDNNKALIEGLKAKTIDPKDICSFIEKKKNISSSNSFKI